MGVRMFTSPRYQKKVNPTTAAGVPIPAGHKEVPAVSVKLPRKPKAPSEPPPRLSDIPGGLIRGGVEDKKRGRPGPSTVGSARKRKGAHKSVNGKRKPDRKQGVSGRRARGEVGQLGDRKPPVLGDETTIPPGTEPVPPEQAIRAAVNTMAQINEQRDAGMAPGQNINPGKSLARSRRVWAELVGAKQWILERLDRDLDLKHASFTLNSLADAFAEITLLRQSLFLHMMEGGGPLTGGKDRDSKKIKSSLHVYVAMVDREDKLARSLGLTRREVPVNPLDAVTAAVEAARHDPDAARESMAGENGVLRADPWGRDVPRGKPGWPKGKPRGPRTAKQGTVIEAESKEIEG